MKNPAPVKGGAYLSRKNPKLIIADYMTGLMISNPGSFRKQLSESTGQH